MITSYILHLADSTLIQSQRLSEWTGHGPALEQDIAMTNIALDYIGQARNYYQYAATLIGGSTNEDTLAYHRDERQFSNHLLVEQPNGDWAQSILKIFFLSAYQKNLYQQLVQCPDEQLAAIAEKSLKEVTYHLRWSSEWVVRLGDGTSESHRRMNHAINELWMFTGELFEKPVYDPGWINYEALQNEWQQHIATTFNTAGLNVPQKPAFQTGGLKGVHTEHLGYILAEMQYLQRVHPNAVW